MVIWRDRSGGGGLEARPRLHRAGGKCSLAWSARGFDLEAALRGEAAGSTESREERGDSLTGDTSRRPPRGSRLEERTPPRLRWAWGGGRRPPPLSLLAEGREHEAERAGGRKGGAARRDEARE